MQKIDITFEELYEFMNSEMYVEESLFVRTQRENHFTPIKEITTKMDYTIGFLMNEQYVEVGKDHIFLINDFEVKAKFLPALSLLDSGPEHIKMVEAQKVTNFSDQPKLVYDINIAYPHLYQLSEDIPVISHNTLYLANYVAHAIKNGKNVMVFTMEDGVEKWAGRVDQNILEITREELMEKGSTVQTRFEKMVKDSFGNLKLESMPTGKGNVNLMRKTLDKLKSQEGFEPDLIVADYLGIMEPTVLYKNSYEKGKFVAEEFRALGQELKCATVSAQQFNRAAFGGKNPGTENTQDSIGIPQTADAIASIRELSDESNNKHIIGGLKSRSVNKRHLKDEIVLVDTERQMIKSSADENNPDKEYPKQNLPTKSRKIEGGVGYKPTKKKVEEAKKEKKELSKKPPSSNKDINDFINGL